MINDLARRGCPPPTVRVHWPNKAVTSDGLVETQRQGVHTLFARFIAEFEPTQIGYRSRERQLADGTRVRITSIGDLDFVDVWPISQPAKPPLAGIGILFTSITGAPVEGWRRETSPGVFAPVPALVMSSGEGKWRVLPLAEMIGGHLLWRRPATYRWVGASIAGPFCTRMNLTVRAMHVPSAIAPPFIAEAVAGRRLYHISPSGGGATVWSGPSAALFGLQDKVTLDEGDYIGPTTYGLALPLPLLEGRRLAIHPEGTSAVAVANDKDTLIRFVFDPASTGTFSVEAEDTEVLTPVEEEVTASGVKTVVAAGGDQPLLVKDRESLTGLYGVTTTWDVDINHLARWKEDKVNLTYVADTDKQEMYGIHMKLDGTEAWEILKTTGRVDYSESTSEKLEEMIRDYGYTLGVMGKIRNSAFHRPYMPTKLVTTYEETRRWEMTRYEDIDFEWGEFRRYEEELYLREVLKRKDIVQFKAEPPLPDPEDLPHYLIITDPTEPVTTGDFVTYEVNSLRPFANEELTESATAEYSGRIKKITRTLLWHDPEMRFTASVEVEIGHAIEGTQDLGTDPELPWPPPIGDLSPYLFERERSIKLILRQDGVEVFSAEIPPFATKATMRERDTRVVPTYELVEDGEEKWTTKFAPLVGSPSPYGPDYGLSNYMISSSSDSAYAALSFGHGSVLGIDYWTSTDIHLGNDIAYFKPFYGVTPPADPIWAIRPNSAVGDSAGLPLEERLAIELPAGHAKHKAQLDYLQDRLGDVNNPPNYFREPGTLSAFPTSTVAYQTYEKTKTYEVHSPPSSPATIPLPFDTARDEDADPDDPVPLFSAKAAKDPISGGIVIHIDFDGSEYQGGEDQSWTFAVSTFGITPLQKVLGISPTTQLKLVANATTSLVSI